MTVHIEAPGIELVLLVIEGKAIAAAAFYRIDALQDGSWIIVAMPNSMAQCLSECVNLSLLAQHHSHILAASHFLRLVVAVKSLHAGHGTDLLVSFVLKFAINHFHLLPAFHALVQMHAQLSASTSSSAINAAISRNDHRMAHS